MTLFQNMRRGTLPARLTVEEIYDLTAAGVIAENEHLELIDGEVVPMAAAKAGWHSRMEAALNHMLVRQLPDYLWVYPAPSITLAEHTLLEPDLVVLPRQTMVPEVRGPDILLLIEVSDSSLSYDLRVKAPIYAAYAVREYWVVDAVRRTIRVHRLPVDGTYTDVEEYESHDSVDSLLAGVTIRLDTLD